MKKNEFNINEEEVLKITNFNQLTNLIFHKKSLSTNIILWQNIDDLKIKCHTKIANLNIHEKTIDFISSENEFNFLSKYPVYFYSSNKFFIFKAYLKLNTKFKITLKIPNFILAKEERITTRYHFNPNNNKNLISLNTIDGKVNSNTFMKNIIDISTNGVAFKNYKYDIFNFKRGDKVNLNIGLKENFYNSIEGTIYYRKVLLEEDSYAQFYRVGIKFDIPISI